ncbi:MAG TPA: NAD(P)H-hydrate epimerase, partial [Gammaproteobacteria bacterium]|nr:NAD(P)H-hydrate epimerase [Gammaproteobacteria bacterium]
MKPLPQHLYRAEGVRALDRTAIETFGVAGGTLMGRAGAAAFEVLREHWPAAREIGVLCGAGNNAGDGYVVARLAHEAGRSVTLIQAGNPSRLKGDA